MRTLEAKGQYKYRWEVPSSSNPDRNYVVSMSEQGTWACSCIGWTRHVPRKDCKHITLIKMAEPPAKTFVALDVNYDIPRAAPTIKNVTPKPPTESDRPYFVLQTRRRITLVD